MLKLRNCRTFELRDIIIGKTVYGFGAALKLKEYMKRNSDCELDNIITAISDNDKNKWGTIYELNGKKIPVISPGKLFSRIKKGDVLIITSQYFIEIILELDKVAELDGIECYILNYIEGNFYKEENNNEKIEKYRYKEFRIPRHIHYCWFGGKEIPESVNRCIKSWKKFCPEYKITLWNESNYNINKNEYLKMAYKEKKWAFVSDYARLDIIYNYGGVYLDTDVELLRPLDYLMHFDAFMGFESRGYVNTGLGFGAIPKHLLIKEMKKPYETENFWNLCGNFQTVTCIKVQTKVLEQYGLMPNNSFQFIQDTAILPTKFLCGKNTYTGQISVSKETYAIHHYDYSWGSPREQINSKQLHKYCDWILNRMVNE